MTRQQFIEKIAPIIRAEAFKRGYKYPSAIIGQACIESNFGASTLSSKYHNYFGMKCGSSWRGKSVNMVTKEEYTKGTLTNISANFRAFDSMEEGVKGYFDFISMTRYSNLKSAISSYDYIAKIKADGYATSSSYVSTVYAIVTQYNLKEYDNEKQIYLLTDLPRVKTPILKGNVIRHLQERLTANGYVVDIDGKYGKNTNKALIDFINDKLMR